MERTIMGEAEHPSSVLEFLNKSYSVTSRSSPCRVESVVVVVDAVDACGGVQRIPGSPRIDRYLDATHTLLPVLQLASESRMRIE